MGGNVGPQMPLLYSQLCEMERGETTVLGYYTPPTFTVKLGSLPVATATQLPRYPLVPVTRLGRLAVDQTYKERAW
jgi:hypothetical protein